MESIDWSSTFARPGQLLSEHAANVSKLAAQHGGKFGLSELLRFAGLWHDYGKVTPEFQKYLKCGNEAERGKVQHSIFGAKRAYENTATFPYAAEILGNIIAAHHGALYDNLSPDGSTPVLDRLAEAKSLATAKSLAAEKSLAAANDLTVAMDLSVTKNLSVAKGVAYPKDMAVPIENPAADINTLKEELLSIFNAIPAKDKPFCMSMLIKLAYSCLVDADRFDAYLSESGESHSNEKPDWDALLAALERKLAAYDTHSEMARLRKRVSDECAQSGLREIGIYKLEAPTGSGKTLSSLRFALEHARLHGMDRIIYIIPFLSIISQTAKEIRRVFGGDENIVLEHHSDFIPDHPDHFKLQTDRWDAPIILSTQIQFLESIFSAKGSDLRKLHNISRCVIIFDEAQSLPVKCIHLFNGAINFLHRVCGCTILLCTATQPLLDTVERPVTFSQNPSIAICGATPKLYHIVNSIVPGGYTYPELAAFVIEKHTNSTLVIVNTKNSAKMLHEELKRHNIHALHLSTNMCAAHRDNVIAELRRRLDAKESAICISTQLIEAGVDISLECVIRDIAGLDSIYQAAGRCNRHGEYDEVKNVYIINIKGQNLDRLPDIKIGAEITQRLFDESNPDINEYYRYFFYARSKIMDYPTRDGGSLYDLLAENKQGRGAYRSRADKQRGGRPPALLSAIRSASDEFYIIDRGRTEVVVPYGDGEDIASLFIAESSISLRRKLIRTLGKYTVSLYKYQIDDLSERGALYNRDSLITLARGFYDVERGVDFEGAHEFLYI